MDESLVKLVEKLLQASGKGALSLVHGGLEVAVGPAPQGGIFLSVRRPGDRVGEREAVDIAVQIHRLIDRAGEPIEPEMLAYRGPERARCFLLGMRDRATA